MEPVTMIRYENPFKAYVAMTPNFWSEATADSYKAMRALLLTVSWWFWDIEGLDNDSPAEPDAINTFLSNTTYDFMPPHDVATSNPLFARDYAPVLIDIEHWYAYTSQGITEAESYATYDKIRTVVEAARNWFGNRKLSYYGLAPLSNWYAVKNYLADPENESYASVYRHWQKDHERLKSGGNIELKNNFGPFAGIDFLSPDPYMPNDTTYDGSTNWYTHADALLWHRFFQTCMREARRVWQKPILPYIQPYKPNTNTYLGNAFFTHMMDTAYAERDTINGFIVYQPSNANSTDWRDTFKTWVETHLL